MDKDAVVPYRPSLKTILDALAKAYVVPGFVIFITDVSQAYNQVFH